MLHNRTTCVRTDFLTRLLFNIVQSPWLRANFFPWVHLKESNYRSILIIYQASHGSKIILQFKLSHWSEPQLDLTCNVYFLGLFCSPRFWKIISQKNSTINWFCILSGYVRHTVWSSRVIVDTVVAFCLVNILWLNLEFKIWSVISACFFQATVVFCIVIECFNRSHYCNSSEKNMKFISPLTSNPKCFYVLRLESSSERSHFKCF